MEYVVWIILICCSAANGLIYSDELLPHKYLYMAGVLVVSAVMIIFYYRHTKSWCIEGEFGHKRDYYEYHESIFIRSLVIVILMVFISLIYFKRISGGLWVGEIMACISFSICSIREAKYIWKCGPKYFRAHFFDKIKANHIRSAFLQWMC